jgi:hypothetical protein
MNLQQKLAAALGCALEHMDPAHPDAVSAREALAEHDAAEPFDFDASTAGELHDNGALFLRMSCGTAKGDDSGELELSTTMSGSPIVRSEKTGHWFTLSWQDIVRLAVARGVAK